MVVLEIFLKVVIKKFKSCNIILKKLNISTSHNSNNNKKSNTSNFTIFLYY